MPSLDSTRTTTGPCKPAPVPIISPATADFGPASSAIKASPVISSTAWYKASFTAFLIPSVVIVALVIASTSRLLASTILSGILLKAKSPIPTVSSSWIIFIESILKPTSTLISPISPLPVPVNDVLAALSVFCIINTSLLNCVNRACLLIQIS